jgi:hypothetical protein
MGYEINVAHNGRHLFATHERSMSNKLLEQALDMMRLMCEKFPESEGYEVTMTEWRTTGRKVSREELDTIPEDEYTPTDADYY